MIADDTRRRAAEAQSFLDSSIYADIRDRMEKQLLDAWANGAFSTCEQREEAFNRVRGFRVFLGELQRALDELKVAKVAEAAAVKREKGQDR